MAQTQGVQTLGGKASPLLVADGVTLQYKTTDHLVTATWRVSFEVFTGERFVLLGPSGCGKSTLLKAIAGFMQPVEGAFRLAGKPITKPGSDRMMVFQEFDQLLPWKTVLGNVAMGPLFHGVRKKEALTDARQFEKVVRLSAATQSMSLGNRPIEISKQVGGAFTLFGGHILGRQIELIPNERIVQAWRVADWNPGVYSIAKFELMEQGSGAKIIFDHTGFPEGQARHLAAGWTANYWEPLQKYLAS